MLHHDGWQDSKYACGINFLSGGTLFDHYSLVKIAQNISIFKYLNTSCFRHCTKMKFTIKDFFSKCDQIRSFLNFIFCAVRSFCLEYN